MLMILNNLTSVIYFLKKMYPDVFHWFSDYNKTWQEAILLGVLKLSFSQWSVDEYIHIWITLVANLIDSPVTSCMEEGDSKYL